MTYVITATIRRAGGLPVEWLRFSQQRMSKADCEKMLSKTYRSGRMQKTDQVSLDNFACTKISE